MTDLDPRLTELAEAYGISTAFWDWKGEPRTPSAETVTACLKALDVAVDGDDWIDEALADVAERPWRRPLPPCVVTQEKQESVVDVHVPAGRPALVWVRLEDGSTYALDQVENTEPDRLVGDMMVGRASFRLPPAPPGYHTLFLASDDRTADTAYIVTPAWLGAPQLGIGSVWGFMAQLYSMYGETSWGVGDYADLADLAVWAKSRHGADYILTNPTHAAEVIAPMEPSPYLPATRAYINPLYIRPEWIEEYATAPASVRDEVGRLRAQARAVADTSDRVERDAVWAAKEQALRLIFAVTPRQARQLEFFAYVDEQGEPLRLYATWCALTRHLGRRDTWPAEYAEPHSPAVAEFARQHAADVSFFMWLQWIALLQSEQAQATAHGVGMKLGLMSDLAVGVDPLGEETWAAPDLFAAGVTVGAPPDAYNQSGQDWRQPPWRPDRLEDTAYAAFRDMIRGILTHSGALRVDHIIGLFRLWWIPDGLDPTAGAYVTYNHEAMVGILALEAQRAGAVIIGEDLGTVEPWVRQYLAGRGVLGTSVLWFELDDDGRPLNPEQWRQWCLGSVTTHDLPPTLGYLAHDHVALRYRLGLLTESLDAEIDRDAREQSAILAQLSQRGLMAPGESDPEEILLALHRFLYQTPAKLKCVALTDAVGDRRTQNQPGTVNEYPNWRVPLTDAAGERLSLERMFTLEHVRDLTNVLNGKV